MRQLALHGIAVARSLGGRLRVEAGIGLVEAVIAMSLFLVVGTAMADVLSSSATSHGFTADQTLGQEAADAQIEDVRALPYSSIGTVGGPIVGGKVQATESAADVGITGLSATVATSIQYVGDGIPDGYNSTTNYKQVTVTVTRDIDDRTLATESTYIAPPSRAPYGGINQVALGAYVTDIGDNEPVPGVTIALTTGPSAPLSDTTDTNGGVLFAGMTSNPSTGPNAYYTIAPAVPPGYVEMAGDIKTAQLSPGVIKNLSIRVYQPATIYLHLTSGGSDYTGNATVTVTPASGTAQSYSVGGDPGGSYSIPNVTPNAEYTVTASNSAGLISKAVDQWVPNDYPNDLTSSFTLDLAPPTGTLSVTTLNGSTPIAGVALTVTGGPSGVTLTGTTDANGVANFPSIPAGAAKYMVTGTFGAATFQTPAPGVTVATNQPTPVTLGVNAGAVTATITDGSSHPLKGVTLTLTGPNGFSTVGTTDGSGTWTFPNVGTGTGYALSATDGAASASTTGISVATGITTNIALSLFVGTITVNVTDGLNPLTGIPVTLTGPNSLVVIGTTDTNGNYSFSNVGAGSGYVVSAADGAATASTSTLTVSAGGTTPANLTLTAGSILATITENGSPLPNAKVTVTGPNAFSSTVNANSSGVATITGVGSGSGYTVTAYDGPGSAQQTGVSVSTGSTTSVSVDIPVGSLKVTVDAGATPVAGITVTLTGPGSYSATGTTDSTGTYTFSSVAAGTGYTVTAGTTGSTVNQTGVAVTAGAQTHVGLLLPTGTIRVSVSLGTGALPGQTVTLTGPNSYSVNGQTDSTGLAVFDDVPVGTGYTVSTTYGSTVTQSGIAVTKGTNTNVAIAIPAGSLKVTVQSGTGTGLSGAALTLSTTNGITVTPASTGSNGTYTFNLPVATGYKVTATYGPGSVTSASQSITSGATTSVTLTISTGTVTVKVQNSAGTNYTGGSVLTLTGPGSFSATNPTISGGIATFSNVPAGLGFSYSATATYAAASANSAAISVTSGNTTSSTITIPTGTLSVTVTAGGTKVGGAPVTVAYPGGFTLLGTTGTSGAGLGVATISNVPAGPGYSVSATDSAGSGTTTGVTVTAGSTTAASIAIPVGTLAVTVTLAGANVTGANVTVTNTGGFSVTGTTDASGLATISNVPAGTGYSISATSGSATGTATGVAVTAGNTTPTTIALPTGSVKITVTVGSAYGPAVVTLTNASGYTANLTTPSTGGSTGIVTFTGVPVGSGYTATTNVGAGTFQQTSITVTSGATTSKTLAVPVGTAKITVKNSSSGCSTITTGVTVTVSGPNSYTATVVSNSSGLAQFNNLPSGASNYTASGDGTKTFTNPTPAGGTTTLKLSVSGAC